MSAPRSPPISPSSRSTPAPPSRIPYSSIFEDGLMTVLLNPPSSPTGVHVLPYNSTEPTITGQQLHPRDIPSLNLPSIPYSDLPLPVDDPRRIYRSQIDGLLLTHPFGALEGGPGPGTPLPARAIGAEAALAATTEATIETERDAKDATTSSTATNTATAMTAPPEQSESSTTVAAATATAGGTAPSVAPSDPSSTSASNPTSTTNPWPLSEQRAYTTNFLKKNRVRSALKLTRHIERDNLAQLDELRRRMKARQKAIDANRGVERQIRELEQQREVERRVEEGVRRRLGLKG